MTTPHDPCSQDASQADGEYSAMLKSILHGMALHKIAVGSATYHAKAKRDALKAKETEQRSVQEEKDYQDEYRENEKKVDNLLKFTRWFRHEFYDIDSIMGSIHWLLAVRKSRLSAQRQQVPKTDFQDMLFYTGCVTDGELQSFFDKDWKTVSKDIRSLYRTLNLINYCSIKLGKKPDNTSKASNNEWDILETETYQGINWMIQKCSGSQVQETGPGEQARLMISGLTYVPNDYFTDVGTRTQFKRTLSEWIKAESLPKVKNMREKIPVYYKENDIQMTQKNLGEALEEFKETVAKVINNRAGFPDLITATSVLVWDLSESSPAVPESHGMLGRAERNGHDREVRLGAYAQVDVKEEEFAPGGKYRGVCKLIIEYVEAPGKQFGGTGWLLDETTVVTAGHILYNKGGPDHPPYGRASRVTVYVGYAVNTTTVEERIAKRVALHSGFHLNGSDKYDSGLIRLASKFNSAAPCKWLNCPNSATDLPISVVGYPIDYTDGQKMGMHMMKSSCPASFDLSTVSGLIEYKLDTFGGNSGGPVFQVSGDDLSVIGVHIGGDSKLEKNIGVPIGYYGFNLSAFQKALDYKDFWYHTGVKYRGVVEAMQKIDVQLCKCCSPLQSGPQ